MINSTLAYVLFSRPQGETSLWLSLLTETNGRLSLIYKGGIKKCHDCRSFQAYQLQWTNNRQQDGGWCRSLEAIEYHSPLTGMANWSGLYANELLHRLLPLQHPSPLIFQAYHTLIKQLQKPTPSDPMPQQLAWALRQFEWQLLQDLGYAPPLITDEGNELIPSSYYEWDDSHGWQVTNRGILGQDLLQLTQANSDYSVVDATRQQFLRTFLQFRLTLIMPNLPFAMRQWWENLR